MQLAVLADIHGNRLALEAVLADIEKRKINRIVDLGDSLYGPLDPAGTCDLLMEWKIPTVIGNQDRIILNPPSAMAQNPTLQYVQQNLKPNHIDWLNEFTKSAVIDDRFFLCHGTPLSDEVYLLTEVLPSGLQLRATASLENLVKSVTQPVILCGHDHYPRSVAMPDGKLILNPGSVGLPAYSDDLPWFHRIETGLPHARYAILSSHGRIWQVEHIAVPYDWETAARMALRNHRTDWQQWLLTGRA